MPQATFSRERLFSFRSSYSSQKKLDDGKLSVIRSLGIARELGMGLGVVRNARVKRSTKRGARAGKAAKRARAAKKFVPFALVNARSLPKRTDIINYHLIAYDLDLLAVTETWLTDAHGDSDLLGICPTGYRAVHSARLGGKRGGGVALIYSESYRVTVTTVPFVAASFEFMVLLLQCNSISIRLAIIYRPPSQSTKCSDGQFLSEFSEFLQQLVVMGGKLLIVGDFNIHVDVAGNSTACKFLSLLDSFDLTQNVRGPTHLDGHTLDLVISRPSDNVVADCVVSALIEDHFAVHTLVRAHRPVRPQKRISYRELDRINADHFVADLLSLPLFTTPSDDLDGLLLQYNSGLASLLDKHAPVRTKVITVRPPNPWVSPEVLDIRRKCRKVERWWKDRKEKGVMLEVDREIVRNVLKVKRLLLKKEKTTFLNEKIAEAEGKKSLFNIVDSFLLKKPGLRLPPNDSLPELVERFSKHFLKKVTDIRTSLDASSSLSPAADVLSRTPLFTSFDSVSVCEVAALIKECPSKSSSRDPIPTSLLKKFADVLAIPITHIVNLSLSSGVFPDEMKLAFVTPLLKKPNLPLDDLNNYRPVSLLSFLSKLVERVVAKQLSKHLSACNLYVPVQSAYRPNHSTETALLKVVNDLLLAVDSGDAAVLALLDQSAAFDTIDHTILLNRLRCCFGLSGAVFSWFKSYLSGRRQSVSISGINSIAVSLLFGVPQGSVLGPVLFTLYNSPIHSITKKHGVSDHFYADDEQIYTSFSLSPDHSAQLLAYSKISNCVDDTKVWMADNKIKFNDPKSDALVVYSKTSRKKPADLPLAIGEASIHPSDSVRNLGVTIDKHLTMQQQIGTTCRNAFYQLRRIVRIRKFLSRATCIQLVSAFVLSQIDYGNSLLAGLPATRLEPLKKVQYAAARVITGARRRDPMTNHLRDLHWLPIPYRIDFKIAVLTFRCLNGCAPSYLSSLISLRAANSQTGRTLRSSSAPSALYDLVPPSVHVKTYGSRAFSNYAPTVWNNLPVSVRSSSSLPRFRTALKTHFFRLAF